MALISFNPAMLAAVQAGRKSVTRRRLAADWLLQQPGHYRYCGLEEAGGVFEDQRTGTRLPPVPCPFGQPGNVVQVQEDSALRLRVVRIRAEQVRCLTDADALAEGIRTRQKAGHPQWGGVVPDPNDASGFRWSASPGEAFQCLLNSIYPTAWARNEWVWVLEFDLLAAHSRPAGPDILPVPRQ